MTPEQKYRDYHTGRAVKLDWFLVWSAHGIVGNEPWFRLGFTKKHAARRMFAVMDRGGDSTKYLSREDLG